MLTITEDKIPIPLVPDRELCDVCLGATDPAIFFLIKLDSPYLVTIDFQESNSAARCILLLSPTDPRPDKHTAVWKYLSPEPTRRVTLLPADPMYQVGALYLAVRYMGNNGNTFFRLKLTLQKEYEAEYYSSANCALYYGTWLGSSYHGRGCCIYGVGTDVAKSGTLLWSGKSLRERGEASLWRTHLMKLLDRPMPDVSRKDFGWSILSLPFPSAEVYEGEWVNGKKDGFGVYQWSDRVYLGFWKAGAREGFGMMNVQDGTSYEGEWLRDERHGFGKAFYPDGAQYQGAWENDMRSGKGVFIYANKTVVEGVWKENVLGSNVTAKYTDGSCYVGDWSYDCRHGQGRCTDGSGNVFAGTWEMDEIAGAGEITFTNGVLCVATWEDGKLHDATFTFPNGEVYVGEWNDKLHVREGLGRCIYPSGDKYEGSWRNDTRHGFGKWTQADGKLLYDGEWRNGKRHGLGLHESEEGIYNGGFSDNVRCGYGVYQGRSGSMYKGTWKDDTRVGSGVNCNAFGDAIYEGLFIFGKLQGVGQSRSSNDMYEGTWLDGKQQGVGVSTLPNGDVLRRVWHQGSPKDGIVMCKYKTGDTYEGEWKDGGRCGKGTQLYADGSVYEGNWSDDKPHGLGSYTDTRGETLVCEWREGERVDERGRIHFVDGTVYEGEIRSGKAHGSGCLSYPDGTSFDGIFRDGIYFV